MDKLPPTLCKTPQNSFQKTTRTPCRQIKYYHGCGFRWPFKQKRGEIYGEKERGSDCQLSRLVSIPSYTVRGHNLKLALGHCISEISVLSLLYISSSEAAVIPVKVKSYRIFPKWDPMKRN